MEACMADIIELTLPFKAEYVSVARLTASGIASRIGFDYETVEDIKVALAEVCNKFVVTGSNEDFYKVIFIIDRFSLSIAFDCRDTNLKCTFNDETDAFGISIINALMDGVEFCPEGKYLIKMTKSLEGNI
jgi:serine/threonine-protein kinase RsbW